MCVISLETLRAWGLLWIEDPVSDPNRKVNFTFGERNEGRALWIHYPPYSKGTLPTLSIGNATEMQDLAHPHQRSPHPWQQRGRPMVMVPPKAGAWEGTWA